MRTVTIMRSFAKGAWSVVALDIGIDLGTYSTYAVDREGSTVLREPSVVAMDKRTGKMIGAGDAVLNMVGKVPGHIEVVYPLQDGVISDFDMTEVLIKHLIKKITNNQLLKPRVCLCVPSVVTGVEVQAVIDATMSAGARKVYLIEEPVAAAIGAGIDLSLPYGNMIVDVGGGTCDVAVLSLNGIVCKTSLKVAGHAFDQALIKYARHRYNLLIGAPTAERIKIEAGAVCTGFEPATADAKGRDLVSGLPKKVAITREDSIGPLSEPMAQILQAIVSVLEKTPPELAADIRTGGIVLTGGGALITGFAEAIERRTNIPTRLAPDPERCVAIGTAKSFDYLDVLYDGFVTTRDASR